MRVNAENYGIYKSTKYSPGYLKHGAKVEGVKYFASKYCIGKGVDIGAGNWTFPGAKRIENHINENAYNILEEDGSLDYVFSSHLLEHLDDHKSAIEHWAKKIKKDGYLIMYLPHPSMPMWKKENLKFHVWNPDPLYLESYFESNEDFDIEYLTYFPDGYMSFICVCKRK